MTGTTTGELAGLWPLFGLLIETPRLHLRLPREDELPALAEAARDIAGPDGPRLQMPWMYSGSPDMERQLLQRHWRALAHWKPASWHLPLTVFVGAEPVGIQDLWAEEFAQRRSVGTGSWITRPRQGRGYGTEARAAVLDLAFGHLGAAEALTDYIEGNHASERVSRKLGYVPNGLRAVHRDDAARLTEYQLRLDRPAWEDHTGLIAPLSPGSDRACPCSACPAPGTRHEARGPAARPRQLATSHPAR